MSDDMANTIARGLLKDYAVKFYAQAPGKKPAWYHESEEDLTIFVRNLMGDDPWRKVLGFAPTHPVTTALVRSRAANLIKQCSARGGNLGLKPGIERARDEALAELAI